MTTSTQTQPAGALSTGSLIGIRLAQALGWRAGAVALLLAACPLSAAGSYLVMLADRCISSPARRIAIDGAHWVATSGFYEICSNYAKEHAAGWVALALVALFLVAAVGLWKRGGAVRDVEILEERVERPPQRPSSASVAVIDGQVAK